MSDAPSDNPQGTNSATGPRMPAIGSEELGRQPFSGEEADLIVRLDEVEFTPPEAERPVLSKVSFDVRKGDRLFLLGGRGAGKSVLIKLITGQLVPTRGTVTRFGRMSFPLGQLPLYVPRAPLAEYVRYVAKSYGGHPDEVWAYFEHLAVPLYNREKLIGQLMGKDRQVLSILLGLLIPFDVYVLDDYIPFLSTTVDLPAILEQRSRTSSLIFATRIAGGIRDHATRIGVVSDGFVSVFDTFLDGLRAFRETSISSVEHQRQP